MTNPVREKIFSLAQRMYQMHGRLPVIHRGSPEWDAWRTFRARHGIPNGFFDSRDEYTVPTDMPPQDLEQVLASVGNGRVKGKLLT